MNTAITLKDQETAADLQAYLQRAKKLDQDGNVRLRAFGEVLAAYVAPIFAGSLMDSGPTVLGLRTCELAQPTEVDIVVPIAAILDRLARIIEIGGTKSRDLTLELPVAVRTPWAGISPPRVGWQEAGTISESVLTRVAKEGIAEVATTIPSAAGGPIAARIRGEIWGRAIDLNSGVPAGAAFVAAGLGFLTEGEEVGLYKVEGWVRLSAEHGHILARVATHR